MDLGKVLGKVLDKGGSYHIDNLADMIVDSDDSFPKWVNKYPIYL
jgi:hypothetical protein